MGLLEELEADKKKLAEMESDATDEVVDVVDDVVDETPEEPETTAAEEEPAPEPVEDPVPEKLDNAAYAKMRREKAAAERRIAELERQMQERAQPAQPQNVAQTQDDPEPDIAVDPVAWVQWNKRQTDAKLSEFYQWKEAQAQQAQHNEIYTRATQELAAYENQFKATVDDYDDVSNFMINELKNSFKRLNPSATEDQILQQVQRHVLLESSKYAQQGLNPVEELYHVAKNEYGYKPAANDAPKKPDLNAIAKNQGRSAGMAGAGGSPRRAPLSGMEAAAEMTPAEWAKVPEEEKRRLLGR